MKKTVAGSALDVPIASLLDADIDFEFQKDPADKSSSGSLKISPEERDILHMVDGTSTVQDIVDTTPMGEFDVYRLLYELATRNLIEEVKVSAAATAAAAAEADSVRRWIALALQVAVFALAAFGAAGLRSNPLTPWRLAGASETALLRPTPAAAGWNGWNRRSDLLPRSWDDAPDPLGAGRRGFPDPGRRRGSLGPTLRIPRRRLRLRNLRRRPSGNDQDDLVVRHAFARPSAWFSRAGHRKRSSFRSLTRSGVGPILPGRSPHR